MTVAEAACVAEGIASLEFPELPDNYFEWMREHHRRQLHVEGFTDANVWLRDGEGKLFTVTRATAREIGDIVARTGNS